MSSTLQNAAAPIASVLMVLTVVAGIGASPTGLPVAVVKRSAYPAGVLCVETRIVVIRVEPHRRLFLNTEPVPRSMLESRLEKIFATRAERVVYILGSPEVTFGEVAEVIAAIMPIVPNVGLLTPSTVPTMNQPLLKGAFPVKRQWQ